MKTTATEQVDPSCDHGAQPRAAQETHPSEPATPSKEALGNDYDLLRALLDNAPDHLYFKDLQSRFIRSSQAQARRFGVASPDELIGKSDFDFFSEEHARSAFEDEQGIIRSGQPLIGKVEMETWDDGRAVSWVLTTKMPLRNQRGEIIGTFGISKDISELKDAQSKIEEVQAQLLTTARMAGMAEIASNVLHNVGNVLNSVNISAGLIGTQLRNSKLRGLERALTLMDEHTDDLGTFLTQDARGKLLPAYLRELARTLEQEHATMSTELLALGKSVDHIKQVIATQQSYAGTSRVVESVKLDELMDDALRMNSDALTRHKVTLVKELAPLPALRLDRHRTLQILVNLINNAKQALDGLTDRTPCITLSTAWADPSERRVLRITVADNGEGIAPENLTRVFSHGFTTRKNGHGFGLHSCVLAAQEMGGSLSAHSPGFDQGATFILDIPVSIPSQIQLHSP